MHFHTAGPRLSASWLLIQPLDEGIKIPRELLVALARLMIVYVVVRCAILSRWLASCYGIRPPQHVIDEVIDLVDEVRPDVFKTRLVDRLQGGLGFFKTFDDARCAFADFLDFVGDFCHDRFEGRVAVLGTGPPAALEDSIGVLVGCGGCA